jgi:glutamate racemase
VNAPSIGVLDSGIGGLSVLRHIHKLLPEHATLFVADQAHIPYGPRSTEEITAFVDGVTQFLLGEGAKVIVIACNTASAASLYAMRERYPGVPFVGMEPAIKPALAATRSGVIGVLSTQATAQGHLYRRLLEQYAQDARIVTQVAPEMVRIAEEQSQHNSESQAIIQAYLEPMIKAGADQIVLACTHFPFIVDALQQITGDGVSYIDPGPAVARQTERLWPDGIVAGALQHHYYTTGAADKFRQKVKLLTGVDAQASLLRWEDGNLRRGA